MKDFMTLRRRQLFLEKGTIEDLISMTEFETESYLNQHGLDDTHYRRVFAEMATATKEYYSLTEADLDWLKRR